MSNNSVLLYIAIQLISIYIVFWGFDLGPKFGPIPNWKFPNIFQISDLKIPNHYQNYKKGKKKRKGDIITQERLTRVISNFKNIRKISIVL
jgi:hypothetical protein